MLKSVFCDEIYKLLTVVLFLILKEKGHYAENFFIYFLVFLCQKSKNFNDLYLKCFLGSYDFWFYLILKRCFTIFY